MLMSTYSDVLLIFIFYIFQKVPTPVCHLSLVVVWDSVWVALSVRNRVFTTILKEGTRLLPPLKSPRPFNLGLRYPFRPHGTIIETPEAIG
jgi:hypothetical protein